MNAVMMVLTEGRYYHFLSPLLPLEGVVTKSKKIIPIIVTFSSMADQSQQTQIERHLIVLLFTYVPLDFYIPSFTKLELRSNTRVERVCTMALDPQQKGCCPPGSLGAALAADPKSLRGENVELHSPSQGKVVAYVSKPPADAPSKPGQCLLVLHDVFGVDSGRTKQICDSYATKGYTVILPDLTRDGSFEPPESFGLGVFKTIFKAISHLYNNTRGPVLARLDEAVLPYLYNELGAKQIALMCFCWGAFPMNHLLGKHLPEIKCAIGFHPSLQLSSLYFENLDSILESIQVPIAYLSAENDPATIRPEGVAHKIMQKKPFAEECIFKEYKGVRHGWVNRGDLKDPTVLEAYTDSIKLSDEFLEKHLLSSAL